MRALGSLSLAAVLAGTGLVWPAVDGPDELEDPTPEQLSRSVTSWSPEGSITYWDLDGSVRGLIQESTEDDVTTISLTSDILFDFASADITDSARAAVAEALDDIPDGAEVGVGGHTDSVGSSSENQKLSESRARAVAELLLATRPDLKVTAKGFGETRPVADNEKGGEDNPAGRALNRRVEIIYAAP